MAGNFDAVIAALRIEMQQAERTNDTWVKSHRCNRWIRQLPGGRWRWRNLMISGDIDRDVSRPQFITHVKATLAYLETVREEAASRPSPWRSILGALRASPRDPVNTPAEPVDAEFTDVSTPSSQKRLPRPKIIK